MSLSFTGKVVLVTGAGAGLGKEYALEFAKRGAKVVVNDLGTSRDGRSAGTKQADIVVDEIRKLGGTAVANYDSVEFGKKVVQTALDNYGRIDVVINNAGILRDRTFARLSDDDWDIVHRVHLRGAFSVTQAAWPHMRKQGYGRVIMTSSPSGLYGNFGQTNYSAAKLGLVGLANTLSLEGKKYGILVNTIAPTAWTRLTEDLMGEDAARTLKPAYISPLVVYLSHDTYSGTGGVFELSGGHICKLRWERSEGALLRHNDKMTAEDVRDNFDLVCDFSKSHPMTSIMDANMHAAKQIQRMDEGENDLNSNHPIKPALAIKHKFDDITMNLTREQAILYALGVGVSTKDKEDLKYIFELNEDFSVLPSFGVIPSFGAMAGMMNVKGLTIDPTKILHGEQYLEIKKAIPTEGKLVSKTKIVDILDKQSGCLLILNVETFDESGDLVFFNQFVTFVVGHGKFGGKRTSTHLKETVKVPDREPDATVDEVTSVEQAALYRLSGDFNPLHIDPQFAMMGGFSKPILHGLCSFGISTKHVMKKFAQNDSKRIKAVKVRFAKPVIPGDTLRTEMWKDGNRIHIQTRNMTSNKVALTSGYVDLYPEDTSLSTETEPAASEPVSLESDQLFEEISSKVNAEMCKKIKATFRWNIRKESEVLKTWYMDLKSGSGNVTCDDKDSKAECTITISDSDMVAIATGKMNAQNAFMTGKMKIQGNMMLATKLNVLFDQNKSKL